MGYHPTLLGGSVAVTSCLARDAASFCHAVSVPNVSDKAQNEASF